jgi:hypothetical protein
MLSVLIKHRSTGRDVLFGDVVSVEFEAIVPGTRPGAGLLVNFSGDRSSHWALSDMSDDQRDVFVMNEAGQTIARYVL